MGPWRIDPRESARSHHWSFPAGLSLLPSRVPSGHVMGWAAAGPASESSRASDAAVTTRWATGVRSARQPAQGGSGEAGEDPLPLELGSQAPVETDGGPVPVEHRPLHSPAPAPDRDAGQRAEQRLPGPGAPLLGQHEEVLEVEAGPREERGVREEVEREADRAAAAPADEGLEIASRAEAVGAHPGRGGLHLVGEPLVLGQAADEGQDGRHVPRGANADDEGSAGHQAAATSSSISVWHRTPSRRFSSEIRSSLPWTRRHSLSSRMKGLKP